MIILVVAGCLTLGCTAQPSPVQPNATVNDTGPGFQPATAGAVSGEPQGIAFSDVLTSLADMGPGAGPASNTTSQVQVLYVHGIRLNEGGGAASWTIAIRSGNQTSIVTYDPLGRHITLWKGEVYWHEIQWDSIIPPETLFVQNQAIITQGGNLTVTRDLVLSDGTYTLTLTSPGSSRILTFNATTGEQLK